MEQRKKIGFIGLFLVTAIATTVIFQNCSKVNYNVNSRDNVTPHGQVTRILNIQPTVSTENSDMKVLFVVDDSYTMSQSQVRLSNALDSLMNLLFRRNVEFKIVSTSGVPDNQIDYQIDSKYYTANNNVEIPPSQLPSYSNYFIDKIVTNKPSGRHNKFASYKNYNQTQFNNVKNQVKAAILNVGVNGSDNEEGFCAALRQLFDPNSNSFFKTGDKAAIIFLTDEDDDSRFNTCVSRYRQQVSTQPVVYYNYLEMRATLTLEYEVVRDGISAWYPVTWGVGLPNGQNFNAGQTCHVSDLSIAQQIIISRGYNIRNISYCVYEATPSTRYGADLGDNGSNPNLNLCSSPLVYQGITYANLYSLITASNLSAVAGSCEKIVQPSNTIVNTGVFTSVIDSDPATTFAQDLEGALVSKSNELFGSGFIHAHIIRKSNDQCALQTGQSYGVKYEQLASRLPQNSVVESLCENDFSQVLSQVSQFIITQVDNSYVIPGLNEGEIILSVAVKRQGQTIALNSSQYEIVGHTINMINFTLLAEDILEISIGM